MKLHQWSRIPAEQMNPLLVRQVIHAERVTIARLELKQGSTVSRHSHENEQISIVERGRLRFIFDGAEHIVGAGEVMQIAPNAPHGVEVLEDAVVYDLFAPVRADWLRGDDAYLRR